MTHTTTPPTEAQREKRRTQARNAIERGLRDSQQTWWQTPPRLDWAADAALDALGDTAAEILVDGTMLRSLDIRDGVATLDLEPAKEILQIFVASMRGVIDGYGAENYVETQWETVSMDLRDSDTPQDAYTVTIQRRTRPTPHELRQLAETRITRALELHNETFCTTCRTSDCDTRRVLIGGAA